MTYGCRRGRAATMMGSNDSDPSATDAFSDVVNGSVDISTPLMDLVHLHPAVQVTFYLIYGSIFTVGVCGNVLVCFVVCTNRAMQTVTNLFIANLALSDILLCVLAVPFTPFYLFGRQWKFGAFLCHLVSYVQGVSVYVSTLTLTSIAIDRFLVILYPFKPRMRMSTCVVIICAIWLLALCATLPYGIYVGLTSVNGTLNCEENWESTDWRLVFGSVTTVMQFVVPFIIMAVAYSMVSLKLADRSRQKTKIRLKSCRGEELDRERKRRTNNMLIAMVTIFGVSWLPLNVINLLNDTNYQIAWWKYFNLCFLLAHTVAMSSTCYNVFVYAWLNDNFRKELKRVLPCFQPSKKRLASGISRTRASGMVRDNQDAPESPTLANDRQKVILQLSQRVPFATTPVIESVDDIELVERLPLTTPVTLPLPQPALPDASTCPQCCPSADNFIAFDETFVVNEG